MLSNLADGELACLPQGPAGRGEVGGVLGHGASVTTLLKYTTNTEGGGAASTGGATKEGNVEEVPDGVMGIPVGCTLRACVAGPIPSGGGGGAGGIWELNWRHQN